VEEMKGAEKLGQSTDIFYTFYFFNDKHRNNNVKNLCEAKCLGGKCLEARTKDS
jgi:hypothetical protein